MQNIDINKNTEQFKMLLRSTQREGIENVIKNLENLGFFQAPASAGHHLNVPGGLAQHSLNVCFMAQQSKRSVLMVRPELEAMLPDDSIIIASLLHDVCKAEIYKPAIKKRKTPQGYWQDYQGYDADYSSFPMGHGEKSVIQLLRWGLDMTEDEMLAIRWHMSAWDLPFQSYESKECINKTREKCPLLTIVQAGDGLASGILES